MVHCIGELLDGYKTGVLIQTICSHSKVEIIISSENKEDITILSKCVTCGKQLNKCVVDKVSGTVEEIMW